MQFTFGALRMLLKRYRLILKKCHARNLLACACLAGCLLGGPAMVGAQEDFSLNGDDLYMGGMPFEAANISITNKSTFSSKSDVDVSNDLKIDSSEFSANNVNVGGNAIFNNNSVVEVQNIFNSQNLDLDYSTAYLGLAVGAKGGSLGDVFIHKSFLILPDGAWQANTMNADCGNLSVGKAFNSKTFIAGGAGITLGMDRNASGGNLGNVTVRGGSLNMRYGDWSADNVNMTGGKITSYGTFSNSGSFTMSGGSMELGSTENATGGHLGSVDMRAGSITLLNGKNWSVSSLHMSGGNLDLLGSSTLLTVLPSTDNLPTFTYTGGEISVMENSGLNADYKAIGITLTPGANNISTVAFDKNAQWSQQIIVNSGGLLQITGFENTKVTLDSYLNLVNDLAYVSDGGELSINGLEAVLAPVEPEKPTVPDEPQTPSQPGETEPDTPQTPSDPGDTEPDTPQTPSEPGDAEPDEPTTPEEPDDNAPEKPDQPDTPSEPANPVQPSQPAEPSQPSQPGEKPSNPSQPNQPDGQPTNPGEPEQPGETPGTPIRPDGELTQIQLISGVVPYYPDNTLREVTKVVEGGTFQGIATAPGSDASGAVIGGTPVTRTTTLVGGPNGTIVIGTSDKRVQNATVQAGNTLNLGTSQSGNSGILGNLVLEGDSNLAVYGNGSGQWNMGDVNGTVPGQATMSVSGTSVSANSVGSQCPLKAVNAYLAQLHAAERVEAELATLDQALIDAGGIGFGSLANGASGALNANSSGVQLGSAQNVRDLAINSYGRYGDIIFGDATLDNNTVSGGGDASQASGGSLRLNAEGNIIGQNITASSIQAGNLAGASGSMTIYSQENDASLGASLVTVGQDLTVINGNVTTYTMTVARNVTFNGCALALGGTGAQGSSVGGNFVATDLRGNNGNVDLGDLNVGGSATITTAEPINLNANNLYLGTKATDASSITGGANVNVADTLKIGGSLVLGSSADTRAVNLMANTVDLTSGRLIMDPAFGPNGTGNTGIAHIGSLSGNFANMDVLQNYMVSVGTPDTGWLPDRIARAGLSFGRDVSNPTRINAALGLWNPVIIPDGGSLMVDGTHLDLTDRTILSDQNKNSAHFGKGSLLVTRGEGINYTGSPRTDLAGAISAESAAQVTGSATGAKLMITDVRPGETYVVLGKGMDARPFLRNLEGIDSWLGDNIIGDNPIVRLALLHPDLVNGQAQAHANLISASEFFPGLDGELVNALDTAMLAGQIHPYFSDNASRGAEFLSRGLQASLDGHGSEAASVIESAARIVVAGAVPQMTVEASKAAGSAVTERLSLANAGDRLLEQKAVNSNFALWIMPLFQSVNGFGMEAGNFDYDFSGSLGGVALGADYTFDNNIRAGLLFNIGGGYARGSGDLNSTDNSMSFWGLGAYVGWNKNNFGIMADFNFTSTYNKIKQDLPGWTGWDELKTDATAWALNMGLRAEYKFITEYMDIIPHVGARYINLNVDDYDVKNHGTVLKGDAITQNIWAFPIGVSFNKEIALDSGWNLKPGLDLEIIPYAGDIKAKSNARFTGTGTKFELETKTMDYFTYGGSVGLEVGKDNVAFGIHYSGQFGAESSSHGVYGTFRYEF